MSDLISRSKVISVLEQLEEHSLSGKMNISNAIYLLEMQPTAFDIDKVVKELEERTDFMKNCTKYGNKNAKQQAESYSTMMMYEIADLVDDLIEIVKHGSVADDVCDWKLDSHLENDTPGEFLICPHSPKKIFSTDIKYCPFCGKKIKVVE